MPALMQRLKKAPGSIHGTQPDILRGFLPEQ
jgi:hypothetical protein